MQSFRVYQRLRDWNPTTRKPVWNQSNYSKTLSARSPPRFIFPSTFSQTPKPSRLQNYLDSKTISTPKSSQLQNHLDSKPPRTSTRNLTIATPTVLSVGLAHKTAGTEAFELGHYSPLSIITIVSPIFSTFPAFFDVSALIAPSLFFLWSFQV